MIDYDYPDETGFELQKVRNENSSKVVHGDSIHRNCVRLHPQNSKAHEMRKAEICWELKDMEMEFLTEARFKDKSIRADIFVLDTGQIIEIETDPKDVELRKSEYPENTTVVEV